MSESVAATPVAGSSYAGTGAASEFQVLVLEDSCFDQARLKRALRDTGLPVVTTMADTLDMFTSAVARQSYDLILIDYMLPDGDGLEAQRIVKSSPINFGAAVVMMSTNMRTDVAVESLKKGSMDCFSKDDVTPDRLKEVLLASAKLFAEASRRWIGDMLAQQRAQISEDIARVVRSELNHERMRKAVDDRVAETLEQNGLIPSAAVALDHVFDADEPFRFR